MGKKLIMRNMPAVNKKECGFVLVTALIMLSLLTLLSVTMYFGSRTGIKISAASQSSTEAYYYAETAISYISWAIANDAEIDNFDPLLPGGNNNGDYQELGAYLWNPGPTVKNSNSGKGITGQVQYFDNSPMGSRTICFEVASVFSNCIDIALPAKDRVAPFMNKISAQLPRYIKLDIDSNGFITPSIPSVPHPATPVPGQDIPINGAIVWITAADTANQDRDIEIFPLDPKIPQVYSAGTFYSPVACDGTGTMADSPPSCPCKGPIPPAAAACDAHANGDAYITANMGKWVTGYSIVAYAVAYVNGKPSHLLRAIIM